MESIRRTNGKPVGADGAHAPARLRRAALPAPSCAFGNTAMVGQGTWFATVDIDGRLEGSEGGGTG